MTPPIDKRAVLAALHASLAARLESLTSSHKATQAGATHGEAKQEHPKDTRAIEQQYLARGLAERVETLRHAVAVLASLELRTFAAGDAVRAGALLGLRDDERELVCFFAPVGGGERVDADGVSVLVVTPQSPLGVSLLGARVGDEVEIQLPGGKRTAGVEWLS
jgi:transcription elongation GreA/GreB family factor